MAEAAYPWYFETDSARDALAGRHMLEHYLSHHCKDGDTFLASLIFGELMANVVKHAPAGGVRVWLEPHKDRFALCIKDRGRGFHPADLRLPADDHMESGRGLNIVRKVSQGLSFKRSNSGFLVKAVLPVRRKSAS